MSLKTLRELKSEGTNSYSVTNKSVVIVGDNLYAILAYESLSKIFNPTEIILIADHKLNLNDISMIGPSTLRGEANIESFKIAFPNAISGDKRETVFLKEKVLRPFSGKSKSEELLFGEQFFTLNGFNCSLDAIGDIQTIDNKNELIDSINKKACISSISSVTCEQSENDIVPLENFKWHIKTTKNMVFKSSYLVWAKPGWQLSNLIANNTTFDKSLIEFLNCTKAPGPLLVKFQLKKKIFNIEATTFLPQSLTHTWGHFIGEFSEDHGEFQEKAEFLTYVDTDDLNEEEVAKRIKLLKKSLEKLSPDFANCQIQENIILKDSTPITGINDELYWKGLSKSKIKALFIIGENGPLSRDFLKNSGINFESHEISHITRALLANRQLTNQLEGKVSNEC